MATLDAHLVAFDRKTGEIALERRARRTTRTGFSATSAPLVVGDLAIIGIAGGEYGVRGFFDAYDVKTGARVWRHYTIPAKGEPGNDTWAGDSWERGGAPAWTHGRLRRVDRHAVLDHRQSVARLERRRSRRRQPVLRLAARRSSRRPASSSGTSSSRRTTCGTTTATPRSSWSTRSIDGKPRQGDRPGQPQRLLLRDRPHQREVPARDAVHGAGELGDDRSRHRPPDREPDGASVGGHDRARLPEQPRRHERRVDRRVQPRSRARVHSRDRVLSDLPEGNRGVHPRACRIWAASPTRWTRTKASRTACSRPIDVAPARWRGATATPFPLVRRHAQHRGRRGVHRQPRRRRARVRREDRARSCGASAWAGACAASRSRTSSTGARTSRSHPGASRRSTRSWAGEEHDRGRHAVRLRAARK